MVPLTDLVPHPANPRRGSIEAIAESLRHHRQYRALVAQKGSRHVLAGNHTLAALKLNGETHALVHWLDVSDDEAAAILIADNRTAELATNDDTLLVSLLQSLPTLDGTGYAPGDLDELLARLAEPLAALTDPDAVPEPPKTPVTKTGDLWLLGGKDGHRLLCGDSTKAEDVARLMGGERAKLMATDPPYLVDYEGGNHPQSHSNSAKVKDKVWTAYADPNSGEGLFAAFIAVALKEALTPEAAIYQWFADMRTRLVIEAWDRNGLLFHQRVTWVKSRPILTQSHFMSQTEPCLYGWLQSKQPPRDRRPPANATNVWEIDLKGEADGIHPTQKPVAIFAQPIEWHLKTGEIAYEPFAGSGTCVIAAQGLGRRCYAMEVSPTFADVICRRFEEFTGIVPVLEATGQPHSFAADA